MTQTTAITEIIQTLADVESRFNITRTESEDFFPEWYENLPEITNVDRESLNSIRRRYLYHLNDGSLTEGTVTLIMGSPLLELVQRGGNQQTIKQPKLCPYMST
jgi:hypothetical protein